MRFSVVPLTTITSSSQKHYLQVTDEHFDQAIEGAHKMHQEGLKITMTEPVKKKQSEEERLAAEEAAAVAAEEAVVYLVVEDVAKLKVGNQLPEVRIIQTTHDALVVDRVAPRVLAALNKAHK